MLGLFSRVESRRGDRMTAEFVCPVDHKHAVSGTCYVIHKCRCQDCRESQSARSRQRTRLKAYGRYDTGLVDAAPAREHLLMLRKFGMGYKMIALAAEVNTTVTRTLLYGREDYANGVHGPRHGEVKKRISRVNSERILAVRPALELLGARITVNGCPTAWRLQALVALGWSQSKLADLLGMERSNFGRLMTGRRVRSTTAVAVVRLYDEISNTLPPRVTWRDRSAFTRARLYAAEHGWALPMDWEAYDNEFDRARPVARSAA